MSNDDPLDTVREISATDAHILQLARTLLLNEEFGGDPVSCLCEALRQLRPGNRLNLLGFHDGQQILGSLRTGIGIVDGVGLVVHVVDGGVRVLGKLR